jgi:cytochrome c peroxidase
MARLRDIPGYVERFREAFPGEIAEAADIQLDHFARAISAFERELITPDSRYDRFVAGDRGVLTETEKLGFEVFFGKGLCGDCHSGPMLCDYTFRVQGVGDGYDQEVTFPPFAGRNNLGSDWGRFHADAERFADMKYAFRVLTVRNAELTAPYFHSGSAATLREVVEFYNAGGRRPQDFSDEELAAAGAVRDPSIRPLELTADEIEAVVAFIKTTTAPVRPGPGGLDLTAIPRRVPSGLLPPGIPTPDTPGPYYPEE